MRCRKSLRGRATEVNWVVKAKWINLKFFIFHLICIIILKNMSWVRAVKGFVKHDLPHFWPYFAFKT